MRNAPAGDSAITPSSIGFVEEVEQVIGAAAGHVGERVQGELASQHRGHTEDLPRIIRDLRQSVLR